MRIVYVLGLNRSGSTVFERTLGSIDGVFAAGELHNLFLPPGLDRTCGCGESLTRCEVWSKVVAEVEHGAGQPVDTFMTRVGRLQARTGRSREHPPRRETQRRCDDRDQARAENHQYQGCVSLHLHPPCIASLLCMP